MAVGWWGVGAGCYFSVKFFCFFVLYFILVESKVGILGDFLFYFLKRVVSKDGEWQ